MAFASMEKTDIQNRTDLNGLIIAFYERVRKHPKLGPFFNETISDWDDHTTTLTDFWETNLFFVQGYKGDPVKVHLAVDAQFDHTIEQAHFGHWLELWFTTVDELYEGEKATLAKERARNMSHMMFIRIWQGRKQEKNG